VSKTRKIKLHQQMSGRRLDGTDWPEPHVEFEVGEDEARDLTVPGQTPIAYYSGETEDSGQDTESGDSSGPDDSDEPDEQPEKPGKTVTSAPDARKDPGPLVSRRTEPEKTIPGRRPGPASKR
jgi:hypothetical protein